MNWHIDLEIANNIFVIFQELAQWVDKVKCYDRLYNLLWSEFPEREYEYF